MCVCVCVCVCVQDCIHMAHVEDFDLMSALSVLEHVNRPDVNCVTVAVDGVRLHKPAKEWRIDRDIEYQRYEIENAIAVCGSE